MHSSNSRVLVRLPSTGANPNGLAVGERIQCSADPLMSANAELAKAYGEDRLGYSGEAIEARNAVVIDSFVGADS